MKKMLVFFAMLVIFALSACVPATPVPTPEPTITPTLPAPEVTEALGLVWVRENEGMNVSIIYAYPDPAAQRIATVPGGSQGKLLGFTTDWVWALVEIGEFTGYMPVPQLEILQSE
jgi:hypothetical protein